MPEQNIPLFPLKSTRLGDEFATNKEGATLFYDGFLDTSGFFEKRPANKLLTNFGSDGYPQLCTGLFYWLNIDRTIYLDISGALWRNYISGDVVYPSKKYTAGQTANVNFVAPGTGGFTLSAHNFVPVRTSGIDMLAISTYNPSINQNNSGSYIVVYREDIVTPSPQFLCQPLSGGPQYARTITTLDGYLLASVANDNKIYWSDVNDVFTWDPTNYVEALDNSDRVTAICSYSGKIFAFGENSIQQFYNAGADGFVNIQGSTVLRGSKYPNSIVTTPYGIFFIDSQNNICQMDGQGQIEVISNDVKDFFGSAMLTSYPPKVSYFSYEKKNFLVVTIPYSSLVSWDSEYISTGHGSTFVYDIDLKGWYTWSSWDADNVYGNRYGWLMNNFTQDPITNTVYASPSWYGPSNNPSGVLFKLDSNTFREIDKVDGAYSYASPRYAGIHSRYDTGMNDWGSSKRKLSANISFRAYRNYTSGNNIYMKVIDGNDNGVIESTRSTDSYSTNAGVSRIRFWQGGVYNYRKYSFQHYDNIRFLLGDVREDVELLGN